MKLPGVTVVRLIHMTFSDRIDVANGHCLSAILDTPYWGGIEVTHARRKVNTLTASLQDWRKRRRAEVQEVDGLVVDKLTEHVRTHP